MRQLGVVGFGNRGDIESMASNAQRRPLACGGLALKPDFGELQKIIPKTNN